MTQLVLPYEWHSVRVAVPLSRVAAPPPRHAKPPTKLPAMLCGHKRLARVQQVRSVHDPIYGKMLVEDVECERCGSTIRRTRYPDLVSRPDTLPQSDRTIVGR